MPAYEILTGRATNPGAAFTVFTMATGDSLSIRSFNMADLAYVDNIWAMGATAGIVRIRSPRLHDNVQGVRVGYTAAAPQPLIGYEVMQRLFAQDVLIGEITGGGAEVDMATILVYYRNLPGVAARLVTWEEVQARVTNLVTVETQHTTGATAGDYGGALALNANFDLLQANVDYVLLGYDTSIPVCSVGYRGVDTGNLRIGGPGTTQRLETRSWFLEMDKRHADPFLPIINAANKGATFVDIAHTATATPVVVQSIFAQLTPA